MKLRTTHNSIRLRIRKSELAMLQEKQTIKETIQFPNGIQFQFSLSIDTSTTTVLAKLEEQHLRIVLPKAIATHWINSNEVGVERYLDLPDATKLHILIEKDFPCLDREEEDKSDTFWELAPEAPKNC